MLVRNINNNYLFLSSQEKEVQLKIHTSPEADVNVKPSLKSLSNVDISRYSRQLILPEFGVAGERLHS